VIEAEMTEARCAENGKRTVGRLGYRSGYYGRTLISRRLAAGAVGSAGSGRAVLDRAVRAVPEAVSKANEPSSPEHDTKMKGRQTGRYKKLCVTDPIASMATTGRNRHLEPAYKQHAIVDHDRGVILEVKVMTGQRNEGEVIIERIVLNQPAPLTMINFAELDLCKSTVFMAPCEQLFGGRSIIGSQLGRSLSSSVAHLLPATLAELAS
jgi:hypothetical protein